MQASFSNSGQPNHAAAVAIYNGVQASHLEILRADEEIAAAAASETAQPETEPGAEQPNGSEASEARANDAACQPAAETPETNVVPCAKSAPITRP